MRKLKFNSKKGGISAKRDSEKGAALVIAILVMLLLIGFVTLVISRVSSETVITSIDSSENRALAATQANLESTSRDFADIFERKLVPSPGDINTIKAGTIADFDNYDFTKEVRQTRTAAPNQITGGTYAGLYSLRDEWEIDITAKEHNSNIETQLRRRFLNDRIPLFQFGIFYENDLELNRPPLFTFGGRVHTNSNLFISASPTSIGNGIYFQSKATVVGEIVNDIWKTGTALTAGYDDQNSVFISDAGGVFQELKTGVASVQCVNSSGPNVFGTPNTPLYNPNLPSCSKRSNWNTDKEIFQANLDTNTPRLDLPLKKLGLAFNELIKRGKNDKDLVTTGSPATPTTPVTAATQDGIIISRERFANKQGLRISMADSQQRLPGCAVKTGAADDCGVRLDRSMGGSSIGYQPKNMQDYPTYKTTALNATRFAQQGNGTEVKEMWIKVELVDYDYNNNVPLPKDITADILSLGLTEPAPVKDTDFQISGYTSTTDSRSIIKLQRFTIPGPTIETSTGTTYLTSKPIKNLVSGVVSNHNLVVRYDNSALSNCSSSSGAKDSFSAPFPEATSSASQEDAAHLQCAEFSNTGIYNQSIVPFPIELYDGREGIPNDFKAHIGTFAADEIPTAGIMSMIDIDVANLRRFLKGDFDLLLPKGTVATGGTIFSENKAGLNLAAADIPENRGWVLFVSDRRGDADFDGEYDMEDVFPDNTLQFNEDINGLGNKVFGNGTLEKLLYTDNSNFFEAPPYSDRVLKSRGATADHGYYRRGVRLINGSVLPGEYNPATPGATRGFTVASENGVYVQGNYNATGVALSGTSAPALSENYFPQDSSNHIPASIVADAVTILSENWKANDSKSFVFPFDPDSRRAAPTIVRFAMLSGQGVTGKSTSSSYIPSQFGQLNGGVHNFKRYLEKWEDVRLNYSGSLVNLFTSRNNNGFFKCCIVYSPPIRDWTFDKTFLDANRLPPGTPYIYTMSFTGFQRVSD